MKKIVNPNEIHHLLKRDKIFINIHEQYDSPPNWQRIPGFNSLSKIILEQQVSLASANAHFIKLNGYLKEFIPAEILKLTDDEMRKCQISRQKTKYLRDLSLAIIENKIDLKKLGKFKEEKIRKQLTSIKGIGTWTTDIYLMLCLQKKDILPIGDMAIINTIKELTKAQTKEEIILLSEQWKPYRSLASYFLWYHYLKKRNKI